MDEATKRAARAARFEREQQDKSQQVPQKKIMAHPGGKLKTNKSDDATLRFLMRRVAAGATLTPMQQRALENLSGSSTVITPTAKAVETAEHTTSPGTPGSPSPSERQDQQQPPITSITTSSSNSNSIGNASSSGCCSSSCSTAEPSCLVSTLPDTLLLHMSPWLRAADLASLHGTCLILSAPGTAEHWFTRVAVELYADLLSSGPHTLAAAAPSATKVSVTLPPVADVAAAATVLNNDSSDEHRGGAATRSEFPPPPLPTPLRALVAVVGGVDAKLSLDLPPLARLWMLELRCVMACLLTPEPPHALLQQVSKNRSSTVHAVAPRAYWIANTWCASYRRFFDHSRSALSLLSKAQKKNCSSNSRRGKQQTSKKLISRGIGGPSSLSVSSSSLTPPWLDVNADLCCPHGNLAPLKQLNTAMLSAPGSGGGGLPTASSSLRKRGGRRLLAVSAWNRLLTLFPDAALHAFPANYISAPCLIANTASGEGGSEEEEEEEEEAVDASGCEGGAYTNGRRFNDCCPVCENENAHAKAEAAALEQQAKSRKAQDVAALPECLRRFLNRSNNEGAPAHALQSVAFNSSSLPSAPYSPSPAPSASPVLPASPSLSASSSLFPSAPGSTASAPSARKAPTFLAWTDTAGASTKFANAGGTNTNVHGAGAGANDEGSSSSSGSGNDGLSSNSRVDGDVRVATAVVNSVTPPTNLAEEEGSVVAGLDSSDFAASAYAAAFAVADGDTAHNAGDHLYCGRDDSGGRGGAPLVPGLYRLLPHEWCRAWRHAMRDHKVPRLPPPPNPYALGQPLQCSAHAKPLVPPHIVRFLAHARSGQSAGVGVIGGDGGGGVRCWGPLRGLTDRERSGQVLCEVLCDEECEALAAQYAQRVGRVESRRHHSIGHERGASGGTSPPAWTNSGGGGDADLDHGEDGVWWGLRFAVHPPEHRPRRFQESASSRYNNGNDSGRSSGSAYFVNGTHFAGTNFGVEPCGGSGMVEWAVAPCGRCDASHVDLAATTAKKAAGLNARSRPQRKK